MKSIRLFPVCQFVAIFVLPGHFLLFEAGTAVAAGTAPTVFAFPVGPPVEPEGITVRWQTDSSGVLSIVIERETGLRTYTESGIPLQAQLSYDLLIAIFQQRSPLHDGAVIDVHRGRYGVRFLVVIELLERHPRLQMIALLKGLAHIGQARVHAALRGEVPTRKWDEQKSAMPAPQAVREAVARATPEVLATARRCSTELDFCMMTVAVPALSVCHSTEYTKVSLSGK